MKIFKHLLLLTIFSLCYYNCKSLPYNNKVKTLEEKPVVIENDSLAYEIIIIEPGFTNFLNNIAQPEGFYSQKYLESRNRTWVITWNERARNPLRFNPSIYENSIDFQPTINYGYDVNYKLFNYFLFAQKKYRMNLGGGFRTNRIN
ncbi:DUF6146 family protein [Polaribacter sp.]|uniref:DUF6146 family protein n=1 Tax=Polaribacter sp. TaxID=1920175 RepID=UPI0025FF8CFD|nr:DUF6146 family protein [Polaribacter sp.]